MGPKGASTYQPPFPTKKAPVILAMPNAKEVELFTKLFEERYGQKLNPADALEVATFYVNMFQLLTWEVEKE